MAEAIQMNIQDYYIPELTMDKLLLAAKFVRKFDKDDYRNEAIQSICIDEFGITATDGIHLVQFPFETEFHEFSHEPRKFLPVFGPEWKYLAEKYQEQRKKNGVVIRTCIRYEDGKGWMLHAEWGVCNINIGLGNHYPNYHNVVPMGYTWQPIELTEANRRAVVQWLSKQKPKSMVTMQSKGHLVWLTWRYEDGTISPEVGVEWEGLELEDVNFKPMHFYVHQLLPMFRTLKHTKMEWSENLSPIRFTGGDGWAILMPCK